MSITKFQFLIGIGIGAISSIPLAFHDTFFLGNTLGAIFLALGSELFIYIIGNFFVFFLVLMCLSFLLGYFFQEHKKRFRIIGVNSLIGLYTITVIGAVCMMISQYIFVGEVEDAALGYKGIVSFLSIGSIISYYIVISLLEEGNKYISGLYFSGRGDTFIALQKYISMSACIALGFAFFENILYSYYYFQNSGVSFALLKLIFFRSIFTVILHLVCSILFALGFWYVLQLSASKIKMIPYFLGFCLLGIASHVVFDSFLSFGYFGIIFVYIAFIYLLISYLFVRFEQ